MYMYNIMRRNTECDTGIYFSRVTYLLKIYFEIASVSFFVCVVIWLFSNTQHVTFIVADFIHSFHEDCEIIFQIGCYSIVSLIIPFDAI